MAPETSVRIELQVLQFSRLTAYVPKCIHHFRRWRQRM